MIADVERAEKELLSSNKRVKKMDEEITKLRKENDALKLAKKGLQGDLEKLLQKRQDIENL